MDAYTAALTLLSRRELSTRQLRDRLTRRAYAGVEIDGAIDRLTRHGLLDDHRVALAVARQEAVIRRRGRRRVLQRLRQCGIGADTGAAAVDEVFGGLDEQALLEEALARRLRGADPRALDDRAVARIVRSMAAAGFDASRVLAHLRRRRPDIDE